VDDPINTQVTISMRHVQYPDKSWGVELNVTGLNSAQQAELAMQHMQRMFCSVEIVEN
jgi:hypothetical protein